VPDVEPSAPEPEEASTEAAAEHQPEPAAEAVPDLPEPSAGAVAQAESEGSPA